MDFMSYWFFSLITDILKNYTNKVGNSDSITTNPEKNGNYTGVYKKLMVVKTHHDFKLDLVACKK